MSKSTGKFYRYSVATLFFGCFGLALIVGQPQTAIAASPPTYTITVTTSAPSAACNGLNASGQTTGQINGTGGYFAMVNTDGVITNLGSLNGGQGSVGQALNNSAQVVGWSYINDSSYVTHNFLYSGGQMIDLFSLSFIDYSPGNIINSSGAVAGYSTSGSTTLVSVYSGGKLTTLGTLHGTTSSVAVGINDNGDVTGGSGSYAFLYKNGVMENLGQVGTSSTIGYVINDSDQIAGTPLFLYSNGRLSAITPISGITMSVPLGINSSGVIVGDSTIKFHNVVKTIPFIFFGGGAAANVNTLLPANSGWVLTTATGIDNNGRISGVGSKNGGTDACYLMTFE